jgi:hypothetical protein
MDDPEREKVDRSELVARARQQKEWETLLNVDSSTSHRLCGIRSQHRNVAVPRYLIGQPLKRPLFIPLFYWEKIFQFGDTHLIEVYIETGVI